MTASRATVDDSPPAGPLARLWLFLKSRLRPAPIATPSALRTFLEERAALIAQKCAIDYVRGKTGLASYALFTEKPFLDALEVCRWETFAVVLGDLFIVAEGHLRRHAAGDGSRLCDALIELHLAALASLPGPAHRASGWGDVTGSFTSRLRAASLAEPRKAVNVADHSAKRLFETLPIHASYRELDEEVVYGAVRFRMVAVSQEMQRRFAPELAARLLAA
ncbi:MAG: hypothetical protein ACRET3_05600 [Burkholderiales bacterium]